MTQSGVSGDQQLSEAALPAAIAAAEPASPEAALDQQGEQLAVVGDEAAAGSAAEESELPGLRRRLQDDSPNGTTSNSTSSTATGCNYADFTL